MVSQSITYDFIGRGAGALGRDFKDVGNSADSAARGAKVLQNVIEKLGQKENRTAAESATLAKALRLTGDAEDRVAARAVAADAAVRRLDDDMKKTSASTRTAAGHMTLFQKALLAVNVASGIGEPAVASLTVAAGGLAAAYSSAAVGLGAFGIVAKSVYSQASAAAQAYETAQKNLAVAQTKAQRTSALQAEKTAMQGLAAPVKGLAVELVNVRELWQKFTDAASPGVVGVLGQALGILPKTFKLLTPFLAPVETALSHILADANRGIKSAGFKDFIDLLARNAGPSLEKLASIAGHVAAGIGGIIEAFMPFGQVILGGLDKATAAFAKWGQTLTSHSGFQSLVSFARQSAPLLRQLFANLAGAAANFFSAFAGTSTIGNSRQMLSLLVRFSGILNTLTRNKDLDYLAIYAYAAAGAFKNMRAGISGALGVIGGFRGAAKAVVVFAGAAEGASAAEVIAAAATRAWGLAMDALPWVALAAAVVTVALLIIKYHTQIWHFMIRVWNDILHIISGVWGWIKKNWPLLLGIITGPIGLAVIYVVRHFQQIKGAIDTAVGWFRALPGRVLRALFGLGHQLYAFAHAALTEFWSGFKAVAGSILGWVGNFVRNIWNDVKSFFGISSPSSLFYDIGKNLMLGLFHGIKDHAHHAVTAAGGIGGAVSGALGGDAAANRALARRIFPWGASQWAPFEALEMGEAGFNRFARNPSSGAYGIPQALPESKLPFAGQAAGGSHAGAQLSWMFSYIASVYGTPANAYAQWLSRSPHWYGAGLAGGIFRSPTLIGVGERGPEMVTVTPAGRGGGGNVYVTVQAPVGSNPREIGRTLAEYLKAYKRGGGTL